MSIPKRLLDSKYSRDARPGKTDEPTREGSMTLAVLDDYADIATPFFSAIPGVQVETFSSTVDASTQDGINQLRQRLERYNIISTMCERTAFPAELLDYLPNLKLLLTTGMKNASIDLEAASRQNIVVTGTTGSQSLDRSRVQPPPPAYDSTTQQTWALLLSLCGKIPYDNHNLRSNLNAWQSGFAFSLGGKTIGILGLGRLGANTARIATQAFGMKVIAWSENLTQDKADAAAHAAGLPIGSYAVVSKDDLFRNADVLSIHCVLSERSRGIVGSQELASMKSSAVLVNTSRGPLVDEAALWDAMQRGAIRGAALDVWWKEPLPKDSRWRTYTGKSELVMSPHMGYVNEGTMYRWYEEQAEITQAWLSDGEARNRLN